MRQRRTTAAQWEGESDASLVEMFHGAGVDAAFEELVGRYQVRLYRVLLGLVGNGPLAEELAQRSLVKAATRIEQLKDGQAFYAWLLSIARSTAMDELRSARVRLHEPEESADDVASDSDPGIRQAVREVLAMMAPDDRIALLLADLQGLSIKETATALDVGESAAKMRVKRARDRFRELYERHGG